MKRFLFFISCVLTTIVSSAHDFEVDGVFYNVKSAGDLTCNVTFKGTSYSTYTGEYTGNVVIPETVTYFGTTYSVVGIEGSTFRACAGMTSITIPKSVTTIGTYAFYGCTALTTVNYNATSVPDFSSSNYVFYNAGQSGSGVTLNVGKDVKKIPAYFMNPNGSSSYIPKLVKLTFDNDCACTSIGSYAFYYSSINSVTLPNKVTSVGNYAFAENPSLKSVSLDANLTAIGTYAFSNCTGITEVNIPDKVISLGERAFSGCSAVTKLSIGEAMTTIGNYSFSGMKMLTSVVYNAQNATNLASSNHAFDYAGQSGTGINVTIGKNVKKIPAYLFYPYSGTSYTPNLASVSFANDCVCTSIEKYAFYNCTKLKAINFPSNLTSIGEYAFYGNQLANITIPDKVITLGTYSFHGCTATSEITLGEAITNIGTYAFYNCTNVNKINFNSQNTNDFESGNNIFYSAGKSATSGITLIVGKNVKKIPAYFMYPTGSSSSKPNLKNISFADDCACTSIGTYAFYLSDVESVELPTQVTSINSYAFKDNSSLRTFVFDENLTSIGSYAFDGCKKLTNVVIPDKVITIGTYAFNDCSGIASLSLGESVTNIGKYSFYGTNNLATINYNCKKPQDLTSSNYVFYKSGSTSGRITLNIGEKATYIPEYLFFPYSSSSYAPTITSINYADSCILDSIGAYAFEYCNKLTSLRIPSSVKMVGVYAFAECSALKNLTIDDSDDYLYLGYDSDKKGVDVFNNTPLTTLYYGRNLDYYLTKGTTYDGPFYKKTTLTSLTFGQKVTGIGSGMFNGCTGIKTIKLPLKLKYVQAWAFNGCTGLSYIEIPTKVTSIGEKAFYDCSNLKKVINASALDIQKGATTNGYVAYYCTTLYDDVDENGFVFDGIAPNMLLMAYLDDKSEISLPTNHNGSSYNIGSEFCVDNTLLKSVEIPSCVESIGSNAFKGCTNLESITANPIMPPSCASGVFSGVNVRTTNIYVPEESHSLYTRISPWRDFYDISVIAPKEEEPIAGDANDDGRLSMADVVCIVNHILEKYVDKFDANKADINNDGQVDMADVVEIINQSFEFNMTSMTKRQNVQRKAEEGLIVSLPETAGKVAVQMDIVLPSGLSIEDIFALNSHTIAWNKLSNGVIRILVYSNFNEIFENDNIARLVVNGDASNEMIIVSNITLIDSLATKSSLADMIISPSSATSIKNNSINALNVYSKDGSIIVYSPCKQEVTISTLGGVTRKVKVEKGSNVISAPFAGIYIVNNKKIVVK